MASSRYDRAHLRRAVWVLAVCGESLSSVIAADTQDAKLRIVNIPRVQRPPEIEDFISGRAREAEAEISDFRQREPADGKPVTQPTTAYLSYDNNELYVVFVCKERPGEVRGQLAKREDMSGNDSVAIYLDTFHDRRRAFVFSSNPLGVQRDSIATEGQSSDARFDTVWRTRGRITPEGFIVWMAIPFKSLRFPNTVEQTWGIALSRSFVRNAETAFWPNITRRETSFQRQMGELHGLREISVGRNIQVGPYVTGTHARLLDFPSTGYTRRLQGRVGADAKAVIRDAFTLDVTVNPDFSQVESDDPQVTINQRFEVYFPEKRPFFIENAGYFETPIKLFFSRRIANPLFGARVTGKSGPWTFGLLANDDRAPGRVQSSPSLMGKRAHIGVGRVQRDFGDQSRIGLLATEWNFGSAFSRVLSADTRIAINPSWFFTGQYTRSSNRSIGQAARSGSGGFAQIQHNGRHLNYSSAYSHRSPNFGSRLGFIPRVNIRQMDHSIGYYWLPEQRKVLSVGASLSYTADWNYQGKLTDWYATGDFSIDFSNTTGFHLTRTESSEFLDVRAYRSHRNGISFYSEKSRRFSIYGGFSRGTSTNYNPAEGLSMFTGSSADGYAGFTLRLSSRLRMDEYYFFDRLVTLARRESVFTSHTMRTKFSYQFTRALSARTIIDYNGILPNPTLFNSDPFKRITTDFLLTYMVSPGTAFYVGYNEGRENLDTLRVGPPQLYRQGPPEFLTGRQLFVKLNYLLRF